MPHAFILHHRIPEIVVPGKRLGRNFKFDSRNLAFPFRGITPRELVQTLFPRNIPILDQGAVGSCTGEMETGLLGTDPVFGTLPAGHPVLDQPFAYRVYSDAEDIDGDGPYPPNDNGSVGQSVMQVAKNRGLLSGYTHAYDVNSMAVALQTLPGGFGGNWYSSFDNPPSSGIITIAQSAYVRGGHEWLVRGVDPVNQLFLCDNSWGTGFALNGSFKVPFSVMERLLAEGGDYVVPVPLSQPAPAPVPAAVPTHADLALDAVAGPWAAQRRTRDDLVRLQQAILAWEHDSGIKVYSG